MKKSAKKGKGQKNDYVTKNHFDLAMGQVDKRFIQVDKRFGQVDKRFEKVETDIAVLKYDMKEVKKDVREIKEEIKMGHDKIITLLDGYIKQNEDFKEEFYIMKSEMREVKKVLWEKLGVKVQV